MPVQWRYTRYNICYTIKTLDTIKSVNILNSPLTPDRRMYCTQEWDFVFSPKNYFYMYEYVIDNNNENSM